MKLFAHRGIMDHYPENTMSAFEAAVRDRADGIETDVHMTRDGELILIHDERLQRTTDAKGEVKDMLASDLKHINAGIRHRKTERIPRLAELLDLVRGTDLILNIEVKSDVNRYVNIEEKIVTLLRQEQVDPSRILFSSFNHSSLFRLKQLAPDIETGALLKQPLHDLSGYLQRLGARAVHPGMKFLADEDLAYAKQHGIPVRPFDVETVEHLRWLQSHQADAVFVNDVSWARKVLAENP